MLITKNEIKLIVFVFLSLAFNGLFAQDITFTYFDKDWKKCEKGDHLFYSKMFKMNVELNYRNDYFRSDSLQMKGLYTIKDTLMQGTFVYLK